MYIQLVAFIYTYSYVHQLKPKEATDTSSHGRASGPRGNHQWLQYKFRIQQDHLWRAMDAREPIYAQIQGTHQVGARFPKASPEYDPYATPKPHADNLIDIPMAEAASASDPKRPLSPPKYVTRGSTALGCSHVCLASSCWARSLPLVHCSHHHLPVTSHPLPQPWRAAPRPIPWQASHRPHHQQQQGPSNPGVASTSAPSGWAHTLSKKTGWKSKLVSLCSLWEQEDWPTCTSIIAKFRSDLTNHPVTADQGWGSTAIRLVNHH